LFFSEVRFKPEFAAMRYAKGTFAISETRDIPLLVQIRNSRFISHRQLFEFMQFAGIEYSRESFNWRVHRLKFANYISVCKTYCANGNPVYSITRAGLVELENFGRFAAVLNSKTQLLPHPSQVPHALELNAVHLELTRKNLLISWKSDVEVASTNTVSAQTLEKDYDAIVDVWNDRTAARFALEYERTLKSLQQYAKIRRALEAEDKLGCILYLTSGEEICLHLANEFSGVAKRLAFATAREFREHLLDTMVMLYPDEPRVPFRSQLGGMF
jgi:hypothetical protein